MNTKIINGLLIFTLTLLAGIYFFFAAQFNAYAEPPLDEYHSARSYSRSPHPPAAEKSNVNTAVDDIINLILKQGFAGAIIVCLGIWTFRTDKMNRAMQKENFDKLAKISQDCSGHMAGVSARLENLEREVESMKQLEMMKGRG